MTLRQAIIGVHHKGCWGSESTVPFPSISMKEVGPINVTKEKGYVRLTATWNVTFDEKDVFLEYLDSLERYDMIQDIRLIRLENTYALLKTTWTNTDSSYQRVFTEKCLFASPVTQEHGYEKYTIITENPEEVRNILAQLECIGEARLFSIGRLMHESNKFELTPKQMDALVIALEHGYYEWPKDANLSEIATITNRNRRSLQENLRRAEAKVFRKLKDELLVRGGSSA